MPDEILELFEPDLPRCSALPKCPENTMVGLSGADLRSVANATISFVNWLAMECGSQGVRSVLYSSSISKECLETSVFDALARGIGCCDDLVGLNLR